MNLLAPDLEDLARAAAAPIAARAGHLAAVGIIVRAGNFFVLCNTFSESGAESMCLLSVAADGSLVLLRAYPAELGGARAWAPAPNGGLIIAGDVRRGALACRATLVALDDHGYVTAASAMGPLGATGLLAVCVDEVGAIWAGGMAAGAAYVVHADAALQLRWQRQLEGLDDIVGLSAADGTATLLATARRSTTQMGDMIWGELRADGAIVGMTEPASARTEAAALVAARDGSTYACGHGEVRPGPARLFVARRDSAGDDTWWRWCGEGDTSWRARAIADDGAGVVVAADVRTERGRQARVVAWSPTGEVRWQTIVPASAGAYDVAQAIAATPDGGAVLALTAARGDGGSDARIVKLSARGEISWDKPYGKR